MTKNEKIDFHLIFPKKRKFTFEVRAEDEKSRQALSRVYSRFIHLFETAGFPKELQYFVFSDKTLRRALLRCEIREFYEKFLPMYRKFDFPQEFQTDVFLREDLRNKIFQGNNLTLVQLFSRVKPGFLKDFRKRNLDPQLLADAYLAPQIKEAVKTGKLNGKTVTSEAIRDYIRLT